MGRFQHRKRRARQHCQLGRSALPKKKKNPLAEQANGKPAVTSFINQNAQAGCDSEVLPLNEANLDAIWRKLLSAAGPMLGSELGKTARVAIFGPNTLALHFSQGYNQERVRYLDPGRVTRVEELLSTITGAKCTIRVEASTIVENGAQQQNGPEMAKPPVEQRRKPSDVVSKHPLIARAMDVLGAQVVHMDEDFAKDLEAAQPGES